MVTCIFDSTITNLSLPMGSCLMDTYKKEVWYTTHLKFFSYIENVLLRYITVMLSTVFLSIVTLVIKKKYEKL